ncbi:MAG: phospholipase [Phycisphaerales bacterium]|nr:phospholipase [Phycisphaerales bacterium]
MKNCKLLIAAFFLFLVPHADAADSPWATGQVTIETKLQYLLSFPPGYEIDKTNRADGGRGWPLVLFLHGSGERGTVVTAVAHTGLPQIIHEGKTFPFIMVAPQCPEHERWDAGTLRKLIDQVQQQYGCDPDRIYVTGLSLGGFGTWDLITRYPNFFAAAAPICGGGIPRFTGDLKSLPIWAFHGEKDPVVSVQLTRDMVDAVRATGNPNVKLTTYPTAGHDCWNTAYSDPELFKWLLAQRRSAATTQPGK